MEEEKSPAIKILLVLFVISTLVIGVAYLLSLRTSINFSNIIPTFKSKGTAEEEKDYGYNFLLPFEDAEAEEVSALVETPVPTVIQSVTGNKDSLLTVEQKELAFQYEIEEGQMGTILIPAIGIESPVYRGNDGEKLLDQGFWHYPTTNMPGQGETILLCHRRYFNEVDPRSCWNLDKLQRGDLIQLNDNTGKPISFAVRSITVKSDSDLNIYKLSDDNYLKIVSCSLEDGRIGGSTHRVVVVAEKI